MADPTAATGSGFGQAIWSAVLSLLGAILLWNGRRMVKEIDEKANKKDFEDHRDLVREQFRDVQLLINRIVDAQSTQHQQNSERLDKIFTELCRRP
jgi:hypothetical protein